MKLLLCALFALASAAPRRDFGPLGFGPTVNFGSRIIGGSDQDITNYPHQVSLRSGGSHNCGSFIYRQDRVLTAAHCVEGEAASSLSIYYGSSSRTSGGQLISSVTYRQHEGYTTEDADCSYCNDIAIIYLGSNIQMSESAQAIDIASGNTDFAGDACDITGWGRTDGNPNNSGLPDRLQGVTSRVMSNDECNAELGTVGTVQGGHICIKDPNEGTGSCNGDSGGPMTCNEGGTAVAAGITSFVVGNILDNCMTSYPSVYTRTSYYADWISANIN